jgi:hypothetical protein
MDSKVPRAPRITLSTAIYCLVARAESCGPRRSIWRTKNPLTASNGALAVVLVIALVFDLDVARIDYSLSYFSHALACRCHLSRCNLSLLQYGGVRAQRLSGALPHVAGMMHALPQIIVRVSGRRIVSKLDVHRPTTLAILDLFFFDIP